LSFVLYIDKCKKKTALHHNLDLKTFLDFNVLPNAVRSFGDLNEQAILFDLIKLAIGYSLMFVYTVFMLGRINKVKFLDILHSIFCIISFHYCI
jgi:hypothetical protein